MSEYIITCDDEVAMWVGNDVETMKSIVRCRDCSYYDNYPNDDVCVCYRFDNEQPIVEPNGFCAWGKRKVEDEGA